MYSTFLYEGTWTSGSLDPPPTVDSVWVSICILHIYMKVPGHPRVWIRPPRWIRYGFLYVFYISIWRYLDIREFGSAPHGGFGMGFYMYSTYLYEGTWTSESLDPPPTVDSVWVSICILHFYMKVPGHPWVWIRPPRWIRYGFRQIPTVSTEHTDRQGHCGLPKDTSALQTVVNLKCVLVNCCLHCLHYFMVNIHIQCFVVKDDLLWCIFRCDQIWVCDTVQLWNR